jgi:GTPase SAR1 family protein
VNLDPAVGNVGYEPNIDIRDTVNYKEVMNSYGLGPNGGILTSLNLFATRFDQVLGLCEKRANQTRYICVDTPGQIEAFTWSASGMIITDAFASAFPTVIVYVVDTPRSSNPITFMSNMTYACSILYKTKLPFLIVFNKTDIVSHEFATQWMKDPEKFDQALESEKSYMSSLSRSLSLVLEEFYSNIKSVGVSAVTGDGMDDFFAAVDSCVDDYYSNYVPYMNYVKEQKSLREEKEREHERKKFQEAVDAKGGKFEYSGEYETLEEEEEERRLYEEFKKTRLTSDAKSQ